MKKIKNLLQIIKPRTKLGREIDEVSSQIALLNFAEQLGADVPEETRNEVIKRAALLKARIVIDDFSKTKKYRGLFFLASATVAATAIGTALGLTNFPDVAIYVGTISAFLPGSTFAWMNFVDAKKLKTQSEELNSNQEKFINIHIQDKDNLYCAAAHLLDAKDEYVKSISEEKIFPDEPSNIEVKTNNFLDYCEYISETAYSHEEKPFGKEY